VGGLIESGKQIGHLATLYGGAKIIILVMVWKLTWLAPAYAKKGLKGCS
jgi:hypothetical protein